MAALEAALALDCSSMVFRRVVGLAVGYGRVVKRCRRLIKQKRCLLFRGKGTLTNLKHLVLPVAAIDRDINRPFNDEGFSRKHVSVHKQRSLLLQALQLLQPTAVRGLPGPAVELAGMTLRRGCGKGRHHKHVIRWQLWW